MRHLHADLIHAWAENMDLRFEVKYAGDSKWSEFCPLTQKWMPHHDYRIKPTPKPDLVRCVGLMGDIGSHLAYTAAKRETVDNWPQKLRLTFDGETGKLKSADVLE